MFVLAMVHAVAAPGCGNTPFGNLQKSSGTTCNEYLFLKTLDDGTRLVD